MGVRAGIVLASLTLMWQWEAASVDAADHTDPPDLSSDTAADIGDYYAWHDGDNLIVVLTVAGNADPVAGQQPDFDRDVLYGIHFSEGADASPSFSATADIWVRFGEDSDGNVGMQITNFPGADAAVEGAVGSTINVSSGGQAWAGLADDPFFFDLEGFNNLVSTGAATSFASLDTGTPRDTLMGQNASVIVLEFPADEVANSDGVIHTWATTSRIASGS